MTTLCQVSPEMERSGQPDDADEGAVKGKQNYHPIPMYIRAFVDIDRAETRCLISPAISQSTYLAEAAAEAILDSSATADLPYP